MTKNIYHIFTHNNDEYTTDKNEANEIYSKFITDYDCARLYIGKDNGEEIEDEDCLKSHGEYPQ